MPTALFLSPHLDDAAFSAGGTLSRLVDEGWRCVLATLFTRSVPNPTGFALACQTDKGLPPEADYLAIRRAEDFDAADALGVRRGDVLHLNLPEAPHRGYASAADLFAGVHPDDAAATGRVAEAIRPLAVAADRVYLPLGHGNHVDHLHVIRAAENLCDPAALWRWHDTPYVLRCDPAVRREGQAVDVAASLSRKLDACAAYRTQLDFQFGGEAIMRRTLADLAQASAEDGAGPAERFVRRASREFL